MSSNIVITTDSTCDLPLAWVDSHHLPVVPYTYMLDGQDLVGDLGRTFDYRRFYAAMRGGSMPTTSQITEPALEAFFEPILQQGKDILHIVFSSKLSATYDAVLLAKQNLEARYPGRTIHPVDSKSACMGQGLLVMHALQMQQDGASLRQILDWLEMTIPYMHHWLFVDSLQHLARGGRLSGASAAIGTMLKVKPILKVDGEGRVVSVDKAKGTKGALRMLADIFDENVKDPAGQVIGIAHSDNIEEAQALKALLFEKHKVREVVITTVGPIIGAHVGPGSVMVFFIGKGPR
jgi:DegV family protein with EDD domain